MANLPEDPTYDAGVYQIETTDAVLGGPSGPTNLPLKNLANRTAYLKEHVDAIEDGSFVPPGVATESYVQGELQKLDHKQSVRAATTANITLTGAQTIDGISLSVGNRVLVKNQTNATENGIYVVSGSAWTRATDADTGAKLTSGAVVAIEEGTLYANSRWQLTTDGTVSIGSTALVFSDVTSGFAPLASPTFTGNPAGPTPALFDNDTSLATTAYVMRALGNYQGLSVTAGPGINYNVPTTDAGKVVVLSSGTQTINLPDLAAVPIGTCLTFFSGNFAAVNTFHAVTGQGISAYGTVAQDYTMSGKGALQVVALTSTNWFITSGALEEMTYFRKSHGTSGLQTLPGGLVLQWGGVSSIAANGSVTVSYPIPFPNAVFALLCGPGATAAGGPVFSGQILSTSQAKFWNSSTSVSTGVGSYLAIGN